MPDDMLEDAIMVSKTTLDEHEFETNGVEVSFIIFYFAAGLNLTYLLFIQIAKKVKAHMDQKWEPSWHVFLGKSFGCHAVHEKNRFVYFTFEQCKISFLIYKAS